MTDDLTGGWHGLLSVCESDPATRARVDSYLDWHHSYLRRGSSGLTFSTQFAKALGVMSDDEIERTKTESTALLKRSLRIMEQSYLPESGSFLMGMTHPSIADLAASTELYMTQQLTGFDLSPWPRVVAWIDLVKQSLPDSWPRAHTSLMKVVKARKAKKAAEEEKAAAEKSGVTINNTSASAASGSSSSGGKVGDWSPAAQSLQAGAIFSAIREQLSSPDGAEAVQKLQSLFRFVVTPAQGAPITWLLDLKNGSGSIVEVTDAAAAPKADTTFLLSDDNFVSLATGKLNPQVAFLGGKLKLQGNLAKAMAFNSNVFGKPSIKAQILAAVQQNQTIKAKL